MDAKIVTTKHGEFSLYPLLTEIGLCYTFNSRLVQIFSPNKTGISHQPLLYKINFFDIETEANLEHEGSNFDVS